jgi:hypothetical protein
MALDYLRQNLIDGMDSYAGTGPASKKSRGTFSKKKLSLLLGGNLIVWVFFAVSFLGIDVFSMNSIHLPKIPQKLGVSGILYNENAPSVIISNQVYGVGDIVEGYIINRITRTEVEFQKDGEMLIRRTR